MNKIALVGLLAGVLLSAQDAGADSYVTHFHAWVVVGKTLVVDTTEATDPGKRWVLPAAFNDWNCGMTPTYISDDGTEKYRNIHCSNPNTGMVVGVSVSCPSQKDDSKNFWIRAGTAEVSFIGVCTTGNIAPRKVPNGI